MHSISWPTLLASAFVALVTTLAVEYLAKPWLEARKERILEDKREIRNALKDLRLYIRFAEEMGVLAEQQGLIDSDDQSIAQLRFSVRKKTAEMERLLASVYRVIGPPELMGREWNKVIPVITGLSTTLYAEGRLSREELREFDGAVMGLVEFWLFLTTSKWHRLRRRKLIKQINASPLPIEMDGTNEENNSLPD